MGLDLHARVQYCGMRYVTECTLDAVAGRVYHSLEWLKFES